MLLSKTLRKVTVPLREVPGGVLLGEIVRKSFGRGGGQADVADFDGNLHMRLDLGEHMQSQIFWHGSYSRDIIFLLRRILKPGMTVIDAGANIGEITMISAKYVGPAGRVLAFEPVDRFADQLEANIDRNGFDHVKVCRVGVAESPGTATIFVAQSNYVDGTRHDGLATLFPSEVRSKATGSIELVTIDDVVADQLEGRVDLIKLDIEGGELAALKGARSVLARNGPALIIELGDETCRSAGYEMDDVLSFLESLGYAFYLIGRRGALRQISRGGLGRFQNLYCIKEGDPAEISDTEI